MSDSGMDAMRAYVRRLNRQVWWWNEWKDLRSKLRLLGAVILLDAVPSAVLSAIGFPNWIVWPFFTLVFVVVVSVWVVLRFLIEYAVPNPGLFFPVPPTKPPTAEVVEVTPELEAALWREWLARAERAGRLGEVGVAVLRAVAPFVGVHVPPRPGHIGLQH